MQNPFCRSRSLSFNVLPSPITLQRTKQLKRIGNVLSCSVLFSSAASASSRGKPRRNNAQSASPSNGAGSKFGEEGRRVTDTLIVLNVALFGVQMLTGPLLFNYGAKINELIVKGQIWRFLTSAFLHGDLLHLGIGPLVEGTSGHARFATVYLGSAVAGGILSFLLSPHMSVGASGAIFGTAGALATYVWRHKQLIGPTADSLLLRLRDAATINLMYGLIVRHIDNWGHLGGLLGGVALSYLLGPQFERIVHNNKVVRIVDKPLVPIFVQKASKPRK